MEKILRHGYTTGACAAAAAKGAALMLRDQRPVSEVTIDLPAGVSATFPLHGQVYSAASASCFIVKDAGDDPDITNGAELHARITLTDLSAAAGDVIITGGTGIGKATKPGLAVGPGEWAINPVPRRMIAEAVREVFPPHSSPLTPHIEISIPDGELRARKTLNARLGIMGGLSILGTTGIVRPISAKAWTDTIDAALDVARACGCETVVFSTGRTSELAAQKLFKVQGSWFKVDTPTPNPNSRVTSKNSLVPRPESRVTNMEPLPEEAYVMMGDHIAHALRSAHQRGFMRPFIACQFAKLVKIACGYENTHAAASDMDLKRLYQWAEAERFPAAMLEMVAAANTAREIIVATAFDPALIAMTARKAAAAALGHAPGVEPVFIVADYDKHIIFDSSAAKNS
jgi:cobalt-precorrin-5B (C1)-methyltransferase